MTSGFKHTKKGLQMAKKDITWKQGGIFLAGFFIFSMMVAYNNQQAVKDHIAEKENAQTVTQPEPEKFVSALDQQRDRERILLEQQLKKEFNNVKNEIKNLFSQNSAQHQTNRNEQRYYEEKRQRDQERHNQIMRAHWSN